MMPTTRASGEPAPGDGHQRAAAQDIRAGPPLRNEPECWGVIAFHPNRLERASRVSPMLTDSADQQIHQRCRRHALTGNHEH